MHNRASIACALCGSEELRVEIDAGDHAMTAAAFGSSRAKVECGRVMRCKQCSFAFSELRPPDELLSELYREMDVTAYNAETAGRERTAERLRAILHRHRDQPGRLLDVGCASGLFLRAALDAGWQAVGLEPSEVLARQARETVGDRAQVLSQTLQEADLPEGAFDAVTLWDVLEHVTDPAAFLDRCRGLLRPGGRIFVNVPDIDSVQARVFGRRWPLFLPEHLNYFNRPSLKFCAEQARLQPVEFGRRPAAFSVGYVLERLSQHSIPAASGARNLATAVGLDRWVAPVPMGEIYGVLRSCAE